MLNSALMVINELAIVKPLIIHIIFRLILFFNVLCLKGARKIEWLTAGNFLGEL
jgi:hypothetical protein